MGGRGRKKGGKGKGREGGGEGMEEGKGTSVAPQPPKAGNAAGYGSGSAISFPSRIQGSPNRKIILIVLSPGDVRGNDFASFSCDQIKIHV